MDALRAVWQQPSLVTSSAIVVAVVAIGVTALIASAASGSAGVGTHSSFAQSLLRVYIRLGRVRNLLCSPCDRAKQRYPMANTCQIPFFKSLSDIYLFVFGYKPSGLFVEIGAYDGESFSNTSGLADMGWSGHYLEPIPQYADACRRRHAANRSVTVHTVCAGERDGVEVELSAAGPFSSAVSDEIATVSASKLSSALNALGWGHSAGSQRVRTSTVSLNTFFDSQHIKPGQVDVMVLDVEGFEWPILKGFNIKHHRPKLVIVEIQEKQARYRTNQRTQEDAAHMERYFQESGYSILYRDVINTIFIDKNVPCVGGD